MGISEYLAPVPKNRKRLRYEVAQTTTPDLSKMFGALNRFISRLDSDGSSPNSRDRYGTSGFQVLRNKNLEIPIEPWYDIVIGINGRQVVRSSHSNIFTAY